jgi:hypothetical protein
MRNIKQALFFLKKKEQKKFEQNLCSYKGTKEAIGGNNCNVKLSWQFITLSTRRQF